MKNENVKYVGKVKLDFSDYEGKDSYSDGAIEYEFLQWLREGVNIEKIIRSDYRFNVIDNFSDFREQIIEWLPFRGDESVLEIGCGCGAVTGGILKCLPGGGQS